MRTNTDHADHSRTIDQTPEQIPGRLSEAQRETVSCAWPYPDYHRNGPQVSYCPIWRNDSSRRALERKGLIASLGEGGPRLTPLGLAVRATLTPQVTA